MRSWHVPRGSPRLFWLEFGSNFGGFSGCIFYATPMSAFAFFFSSISDEICTGFAVKFWPGLNDSFTQGALDVESIFERPSQRFYGFWLWQKPLHHLFWNQKSVQKSSLTQHCILHRFSNAFGIKKPWKSDRKSFAKRTWIWSGFQHLLWMDSWSILGAIWVPNFGAFFPNWGSWTHPNLLSSPKSLSTSLPSGFCSHFAWIWDPNFGVFCIYGLATSR